MVWCVSDVHHPQRVGSTVGKLRVFHVRSAVDLHATSRLGGPRAEALGPPPPKDEKRQEVVVAVWNGTTREALDQLGAKLARAYAAPVTGTTASRDMALSVSSIALLRGSG